MVQSNRSTVSFQSHRLPMFSRRSPVRPVDAGVSASAGVSFQRRNSRHFGGTLASTHGNGQYRRRIQRTVPTRLYKVGTGHARYTPRFTGCMELIERYQRGASGTESLASNRRRCPRDAEVGKSLRADFSIRDRCPSGFYGRRSEVDG